MPVCRGIYGDQISGNPHTVPCKLKGTLYPASIRLTPVKRGTGIVHDENSSGRVPKKLLQMAGIEDCKILFRGSELLNLAVCTTYNTLVSPNDPRILNRFGKQAESYAARQRWQDH